ncbi:MAG: histidine phosphatase family protein [Acidimicrobiia bacterium]
MTSPNTRLVIIRHGESDAQLRQIISGHDTCTGLSDLGRSQAESLRDRLVRTGELGEINAVFTSILPRAIETAQIIAPALGGVAAAQECDWCEIHAGEGEGLAWDEYRSGRDVVGDANDPFHRHMPKSETWAEFFVRAGARLRRVAHEHEGQRVVVVAHGGIIGASFMALGERPVNESVLIAHETVNTSMTEWRWTGRHWRLVRYNDAAHLAGAPLD